MEFAATYTTVDAHTGGEPLRIVTGGVPRIPGATILEKRRWVREEPSTTSAAPSSSSRAATPTCTAPTSPSPSRPRPTSG